MCIGIGTPPEHRVQVLHLPQTGCRPAPLRRGSDRPIGPIQTNGGSVFISDPARSDVRLILSSSLTAAHGKQKSSKLIPIGYGVGQPRREQHIAFISRSMAKPNMPGSMSVSVFIPSQPIRPARYPQVRRAAISVINGSNASRLQRINSSTRSQTSKADAQIVQATISVTIMDGSVGHSEQSTNDLEQQDRDVAHLRSNPFRSAFVGYQQTATPDRWLDDDEMQLAATTHWDASPLRNTAQQQGCMSKSATPAIAVRIFRKSQSKPNTRTIIRSQ
ncbi:hypothetical protein ACLOJK_022822 [Asimina triloba]